MINLSDNRYQVAEIYQVSGSRQAAAGLINVSCFLLNGADRREATRG